MDEHTCRRTLQLVHEHFEHQRAVVIHTNSKATGDLTPTLTLALKHLTQTRKVLIIITGDSCVCTFAQNKDVLCC